MSLRDKAESGNMKPIIIPEVFPEEIFLNLKEYAISKVKTADDYDVDWDRYIYLDDLISKHGNILLPLARKYFGPEVEYVWNSNVHYEGAKTRLPKHKDIKRCVYTINLCLYQNTEWPLWIEGVPYTLKENQAVLYKGNENEHWREDFPDPENNIVGMSMWWFDNPIKD